MQALEQVHKAYIEVMQTLALSTALHNAEHMTLLTTRAEIGAIGSELPSMQVS